MQNNATEVPAQGHGLGQVSNNDIRLSGSVIGGTFVVVVVLVGGAILLHRFFRFYKLEKALRALKIPPSRFQPEGAINSVCTICIADFRPRARVAVLPTCGHVFHRHCLREVVAGQSPRCPLCWAALL
ncbi:hypothetical protein CFC21_008005 [Triticum aestivum]|uniref:RING-type domain-containing protein n=2 Tax=Triticum aestivum TaxID=4565 RepID=A0A3B5Z0Z2_WHEAT|nr:hypothetical protein CFC21_008005 [Triticum aestivum]